ncbi:MAG: MBL fold metallo-hydrolase [Syntrophomonadaceae bacterium]|nr:MBL fold metallo-hydrolase [Syntrophomonadaceae bacterium]
MRTKKKSICLILMTAFILTMCAMPAFAASINPINVVINGQQAPVKSLLIDDTTYMPARYLCELLGTQIDYKDNSVYINQSRQSMGPVKISTLTENSNENHPELANEFGISVFIETPDCNVLFDTGKYGGIVDNAKKLGINLKETDAVVLSHGHYDHCGGVKAFVEKVNPDDYTLYLGEGFLDKMDKYHYSPGGGPKLDFTDGTEGYTYIGTNFDKAYLDEHNVKIKYVDCDELKISKQISLFGNFGTSPKEKMNPAMRLKNGDEYPQDLFTEEVALAVDTNKGLVIVTGCSHTGILNIVETIKNRTGKQIYAVLGGTHLIEANETRIQDTIKAFNSMDIEKIGVSHCTGQLAIDAFQAQIPDKAFYNSTGTVIKIK